MLKSILLKLLNTFFITLDFENIKYLPIQHSYSN